MSNIGPKLFRLKRWLTLEGAASYLTTVLGENVEPGDILRLALDGHLKLSVRFVNHATAVRGTTIPFKDAKVTTLPDLEGHGFVHIVDGTTISGEQVVVWETGIASLEEVFDLPLVGSERLDVEHLCQRLSGGPDVELMNLEGTFVTMPDGHWFKLMTRYDDELLAIQHARRAPRNEAENYYPSDALPSNSEFVVRTVSLRAFENHLTDIESPISKELEKRERVTLLILIGALAQLAKIDLRNPSKAATSIESTTVSMGARVAARTIENHLNRVTEAVEDRG